ncbi:HEAT repeat domain-containing protein [Niallia sp. NCCP-28]|uniref:HEAT repeat domain-containing protein n=1 Tax=Niallia sp. NCCP-28 TaxID=2934712 RepID=UPI00207DC778|nr:HEAT repeat domain-containing protein [Niallia sp. NCCP-28]GKU81623.1 hypothetical protein NCCP28_10190 [Niallia sp. NCCP-28]
MGQELKILAAVALAITGVLFMLLIYLVIRKYRENNREKKIQKHMEQLEPKVFFYIQNPDSSFLIRVNTPLKKAALEMLLSRYAGMLEGEKERQALKNLALAYLKDFYQERLYSRNWSIRMNTLYFIEDFYLIELQEDVIALIQSNYKKSKEEKGQILRILASFQYKSIKKWMYASGSFSEIDYRNIIIRLEEDIFYSFVESFQELGENLKLALLDVISIKKDLEYLPFLEEIFWKSSGELRLRALKAIASIGIVQNIDSYLQLAESEQWQERMMLAKLLGSKRNNSYLPLLKRLMNDSTWWVRSQSAESISRYKNGQSVLNEVLEYSNDPYAKDMAWEWINKGAR